MHTFENPDDHVVLPEIISNNLASLQPEKTRYAKTAWIELTPEGVRMHSEFFSSAIRSCRRFTYEEVDEYLEDRDAWVEKLTPDVHRLLADMHELAMALRRRRLERGAIEVNMPEVKIDLDRNGDVVGARVVENTESHQIIEEFMLAGNQAVATWLDDLRLNFLHRVHPPPERRKLRQLANFVKDLGIKLGRVESRFEIQAVLDAVAKTPLEGAHRDIAGPGQ